MKGSKDLNAIMDKLLPLIARNDVEPQQKKSVEAAIEHLRRFRRKHCPTRAETFRCVREVAEELLRAFVR